MNESELRERLRLLANSYTRARAALVPSVNVLLDEGAGLGGGEASVLADVCGAELSAVEGLFEQYRSNDGGAQSCDLLCFGTICHLLGAKDVYERLRAGAAETEGLAGEVAPTTCLGHCYAAPVLKTRDGALHRVALDETVD